MKNLLIGVDLQNDFMNKTGKLYVPGAEEIKQNVQDLFDDYSYYPIPLVLLTQDWHSPNDPELSNTPDFIKTFPHHCIAETRGARIIKEVNGCLVPGLTVYFHKPIFSIWKGNTDFHKFLHEEVVYVKYIYVCGVSGDVCVKHCIDGLIQNKGDGFDFENLIIVENCIASLNKDDFKRYIYELDKNIPYVSLTTSNQIEF